MTVMIPKEIRKKLNDYLYYCSLEIYNSITGNNHELNEYSDDGRLLNGYDHNIEAISDTLLGAWVKNGQYIDCGHPFDMACGCYGRKHAGEQTRIKI